MNENLNRKDLELAIQKTRDSFDTDTFQLIGRRVAGREFAKGLVNNLYQGEELNILVYSEKEKEKLKRILSPYLLKNTSLNIKKAINELNLNKM